MSLYRDASTQRKLTFVILVTGLLGLSLSCMAFEIYERASYRKSMTSELSTLADTLGANSTASLALNDHQSALDILSALLAERHIVAACLYDKHGKLFTGYQRAARGPRLSGSLIAAGRSGLHEGLGDGGPEYFAGRRASRRDCHYFGSRRAASQDPAISRDIRGRHFRFSAGNVSRLAVRLLKKRGHRVVVARNGREAVDALERESFELVFMDVQMPEMDGLEATAAIREKCLAGGMDGYLTKPIRLQELEEILKDYVSRRRVTAEAVEVAGPHK